MKKEKLECEYFGERDKDDMPCGRGVYFKEPNFYLSCLSNEENLIEGYGYFVYKFEDEIYTFEGKFKNGEMDFGELSSSQNNWYLIFP